MQWYQNNIVSCKEEAPVSTPTTATVVDAAQTNGVEKRGKKRKLNDIKDQITAVLPESGWFQPWLLMYEIGEYEMREIRQYMLNGGISYQELLKWRDCFGFAVKQLNLSQAPAVHFIGRCAVTS